MWVEVSSRAPGDRGDFEFEVEQQAAGRNWDLVLRAGDRIRVVK
jgi:hypothetical protein